MVLDRQGEGLDEAGVRALAAQALSQQWPRFSERLDGTLTRAGSDPATATTCAPHIASVRAERSKVDRALAGDGAGTDLNALGASLAAMSRSLSACAEYAPMASRGNRTPAERDARRERMGEDRTDASNRPARVRAADRTDRIEDDLGRALRQSARRLESLADRARMMEEGIEARFDG